MTATSYYYSFGLDGLIHACAFFPGGALRSDGCRVDVWMFACGRLHDNFHLAPLPPVCAGVTHPTCLACLANPFPQPKVIVL